MAEDFQEAMLLECVNFTWLTKIEKMKLSNRELDNLNRLSELSNQEFPYVLEFAGLEDKAAYHESDLESAVIGKMPIFMQKSINYICRIKNCYRKS